MKNGLPKVDWKEQKITTKGGAVVLENVRLAFVTITTPREYKDAPGAPTYSVTCLIPKSDADRIRAAATKTVDRILSENTVLTDKAKAQARKTALAFDNAGALFRDGDNQTNKDGEVYDGFEDHISLSAKAKAEEKDDGSFAPKVAFKIVDKRNQPIDRADIDDMVYSGVYADVAFFLSPYGQKGGNAPGVSKYLNGVMVIKDGERLGGHNPFTARDDLGDDETTDDVDDDFDTVEEEAPKAKKVSKPSKPSKPAPKSNAKRR